MSDPDGKRILVFVPNPVGDVVMATPALRAVREHFDGAHVTHVGRQLALEVLSPNRWADETIADHSRLRPRMSNFFQLAGRLRRGRFDIAVLMPNSFRVAALARVGGAKRLIGYSRDVRGLLLTDRRMPPRDERGRLVPVSAIDYYLELARLSGVPAGKLEPRRLILDVSQADQAAADEQLARCSTDHAGPVVMLNPGAAFGPSKMWAPACFAAVADSLVERYDARIIINAAPSEKAVAAAVAEAMVCRPALSFAERDNTLGLLKGLLVRSSLLITNDTGARHIAAALGVGLVTLFGSTDPRWSQIDYERETVMSVEVSCAPCQSPMCRRPAGPEYHQCMERITPEMVIEAAAGLLRRAARTVRAGT
jgi:heptosyltransferase-2